MRTEAVLLIGRNCFGMWWPGTELNRRRQPFQGCALPPELPGHFLTHDALRKTTGGRFGRVLCAFTGRDAAKQNSRCAGTVRNLRIITRRVVPSKWCGHFLTVFSHKMFEDSLLTLFFQEKR